MSSASNRVAFVTGAARGLGLAAATKFLADGWRVIMLDILGDTLRDAAMLLPLDDHRVDDTAAIVGRDEANEFDGARFRVDFHHGNVYPIGIGRTVLVDVGLGAETT